MKIIDITQELFSCRVYPGERQPVYDLVKTVERDGCNLTHISMSVHCGTHIDAPNHFIAGGKAVHELDPSVFYGECTVVELGGFIGGGEMAGILEACHERLIIKGESELSDEAAELIAKSHVRLVGVESQSVGNFEKPLSVHLTLLGGGVIPLEGLDLSRAEPGEYTLSALPLDMRGADGSPVRAVLIAG